VHHGAGGLARDAEIVLSPEESHHVARVLRLRPGDAVAVFDGLGREWEGVVQSVERGAARVRVGEEILSAVEPTLDVVLFQALCRNDRMEWAIQKSTEVGVSAVRILRTARVEEAERRGAPLERWRRIALEAAKQSGRRRVPTVDVAEDLPPAVSGTLALILTAGRPALAIGEYLLRPRPGAVWLAVGPEGGFTGPEVGAASGRGWEAAALGPRTLRTETAGVVAAALVLQAWDDVGKSP